VAIVQNRPLTTRAPRCSRPEKSLDSDELRALVDREHPDLSVRRQCELLGVNGSGLYYEPEGESEENLLLLRLLDEQYTRTPFYGSRKMTKWLAKASTAHAHKMY
jgi:hypothetical protein